MFLKPKSIREQVEEERRRLEEIERKQSQIVRSQADQMAEQEAGQLRLGSFIRGDIFPAYLGIVKRRRWLTLSEPLLDQHLFVLGTTGAGKSETLKRLVYEIMTNTERDLFFADGKGDDQLAREIRAICYYGGRGETPVFRLGQAQKGYPYNGFVGQPEDIYNRLCAMVGVQEAEGDAKYYADINRDLLQLICYAPGGPPRSLAEVRQRLSKDWLQAAWKDDPVELEAIDGLNDRDLDGLQRRIRPLMRELSAVVQPQGFALEETRSAVFSIRTQSVSDTAGRFLQFLIEDFKDFVGKRQRRPGVLIIDEFGAFGNKNVLALLTMARSAKLGVILATQDIASLTDEVTARMVLANTRTKILMATDFPEEVATLAGTIYQVESSIQHDQGEATGMGSARIQHAFKVDMNEAAKLQPGEAFIIRQRHAAKVRVARVEDIPAAPEERILVNQGQIEKLEEPTAKQPRPPVIKL